MVTSGCFCLRNVHISKSDSVAIIISILHLRCLHSHGYWHKQFKKESKRENKNKIMKSPRTHYGNSLFYDWLSKVQQELIGIVDS